MRRTLLALPLSGAAAAFAALWLAEEPAPEPPAPPQPEPAEQGPPAPGGIADLPDTPLPATGEAPARALYGWRDANGMLYISSTPPGPDVRLEWVQAFSLAGEEASGASPQARQQRDVTDPWDPLRVYTVEGLRDLRARAADTARELEARRRLLEALDQDL